MKVGDLVNFFSTFWNAAMKKYANPGIIVEEDDSHRQVRYTILWADGKVTTEHSGLLEFAEPIPTGSEK